MDITPFLPLITGALGGSISAGVFQGPVQTLQDWWYVNFGYNSSEQADMLRTRQSINVENYKNDILKQVSKIKPENIKEPELKILGPALEASKYYIEEEELREMFASLVSSSMDKEKASIIHPSFVEVVKQLSSLDAKIINSFENIATHPLGKIIDVTPHPFNTDQLLHFVSVDNFYLLPDTTYSLSELAQSTSNLDRLGIIHIREINDMESHRDKFLKDKRISTFMEGFTSTQYGTKSELMIHRMDLTPYGNALKNCITE